MDILHAKSSQRPNKKVKRQPCQWSTPPSLLVNVMHTVRLDVYHQCVKHLYYSLALAAPRILGECAIRVHGKWRNISNDHSLPSSAHCALRRGGEKVPILSIPWRAALPGCAVHKVAATRYAMLCLGVGEVYLPAPLILPPPS